MKIEADWINAYTKDEIQWKANSEAEKQEYFRERMKKAREEWKLNPYNDRMKW